jgi:hypothetical protein
LAAVASRSEDFDAVIDRVVTTKEATTIRSAMASFSQKTLSQSRVDLVSDDQSSTIKRKPKVRAFWDDYKHYKTGKMATTALTTGRDPQEFDSVKELIAQLGENGTHYCDHQSL